jgi:hypothetical protein
MTAHKRVDWLNDLMKIKPIVEPAPPLAGAWIQTATGGQFWPLDPQPEEVNLIDIAISLSNQCRFGGHIGRQISNFGPPTPIHYSVAQHSVLVCQNVPHHLRAQALLHDAAEAYIVDVPRPIKKYLVNYAVFEARLAACIGDRFGVELCELDPLVTEADERALATEKRDLLAPPPAAWATNAEPWLGRIAPWSAEESCQAFLGLAGRLGIK